MTTGFTIQTYLAIMAGGALGTGARVFVSNWMANHYGAAFPWGTFVVNVSGCFIIGLFSGLTGPDGAFLTAPLVRQVVAIGILGGYTTFSSFSLQSISLLADGEIFYALGNILMTTLLCLIGTWGGLALSELLQPK